MIDFTKPVRTKNGYPVRILCSDKKARGPWTVVALINFPTHEEVYYYTQEGRADTDFPSSYDLENVPEKTTAWIVYSRTRDGIISAAVTPTAETAAAVQRQRGKDNYYIKTLEPQKVELEI